jgi:hypothetical protein
MLDSARDSATLTKGRHLASLVAALAAVSLATGCAGLSSIRDISPSLSARFWNRPTNTAYEPQYDQYAAAAAATRPQAENERPQTTDEKARTKGSSRVEKTDADVAQSDAPRRRGSRTRDLTAGNADTSVRVTLGRPESLPTLRDSADSQTAVLASTTGTNWKRGAEASDTARAGLITKTQQVRQDEMEAAPDPALDSPPRRAKQAAPTQDDSLRKVVMGARDRLESLTSYQVDITRVEKVGGKLQPEDDVLLSIRRKPKSVRLEWTRGPSKGREVIFASAINDRIMYVNMGNSSLPLPRMTIPVDSPMALRNSRHPITEAGFDTIVESLVAGLEPRSTSVTRDRSLVYKGIATPKGLDQPCHLIERQTPNGETWQVYLSTRTLMPVIVSAFQTASGDVIERYTYRNLKTNPAELAAADAFDPDRRWGEPKGLFSRIARAASSVPDPGSRQSTTR